MNRPLLAYVLFVASLVTGGSVVSVLCTAAMLAVLFS